MSEQSTGAGTVVGDKVDQAKEVVSAQTHEATERGRGMLQEQLDQRSTWLGEQTRSVSQTLRHVADQSRTEGNHQQARMADLAADRGERVGGFLIDADGERMLSEAEDFAQRQPWALAAAGLALGFVLARALKASSGTRYQRRTSLPTYSTAYPTQPGYDRPAPQFQTAGSERPFGNGETTDAIDVGARR
jgi:ElaB/YqjD/DUF883 family membrane-anchored ribosome-binding protein